jgi:IS30 family transposase
MQARLIEPPSHLRRSITGDRGSELARHFEIVKSLGMPVYSCDSHSPWERD